MLKPPNLENYYRLSKDSAESTEYRKLLKTLSNKTNSKDYFNGDAKREKLHKRILESKLSKYTASSEPSIDFLLGSIGSGKTSVKDKISENQEDYIFINFDDLKKELPEYVLLKEINPEEAANFVQSESAKLAGKLFKRAVKQKYNIIFEKNITKTKEGKIHLVEEIKKAEKQKYSIFVHIVLVDSYEEAWGRVQKRYEEIKRFVPKKTVKDTFINLFPNLNELYQGLAQSKNILYLFWYNGSFNKKEEVSFILFTDGNTVKISRRRHLIPGSVLKKLKAVDFLKNTF